MIIALDLTIVSAKTEIRGHMIGWLWTRKILIWGLKRGDFFTVIIVVIIFISIIIIIIIIKAAAAAADFNINFSCDFAKQLEGSVF